MRKPRSRGVRSCIRGAAGSGLALPYSKCRIPCRVALEVFAHHGREPASRWCPRSGPARSGAPLGRPVGSPQRSGAWSLATAPPAQGFHPCTPELTPRMASPACAFWPRGRRGDRTGAIGNRGAGAAPLRRLAVCRSLGVRSLEAPIGSPGRGAGPRGTRPWGPARRLPAAMPSKGCVRLAWYFALSRGMGYGPGNLVRQLVESVR